MPYDVGARSQTGPPCSAWPWLTGLAASPRSAGKSYVEALRAANGMTAWFVPEPLPESIAKMKVMSGEELRATDYDIAFSAVESDVAKELEPRLARDIPVFSAASAYRYEADVPLVIPPVNAGHAELIRAQRKQRGWKGFIVPIPNCTTTGCVVDLNGREDRLGDHTSSTATPQRSGNQPQDSALRDHPPDTDRHAHDLQLNDVSTR